MMMNQASPPPVRMDPARPNWHRRKQGPQNQPSSLRGALGQD
jgi:hypothetical protein